MLFRSDLPLDGVISVDDPNFSVVAGGGAYTVAPGATHPFTVRYTPLDLGPHAAMLATGNPTCGELPLSGQAHVPAPLCVLEPTALDFGELLLGDYANLSFWVSNDGDAPLVGDITLSSEHFNDFVGYLGTLLGRHKVNIASMSLSRDTAGGQALTVLNLDSVPPAEVLNEIQSDPDIRNVKVVKL